MIIVRFDSPPPDLEGPISLYYIMTHSVDIMAVNIHHWRSRALPHGTHFIYTKLLLITNVRAIWWTLSAILS